MPRARRVAVRHEGHLVQLGAHRRGDLVGDRHPAVRPPRLLEHEHVGVQGHARAEHVEGPASVVDAPMQVEAGNGELGHRRAQGSCKSGGLRSGPAA